MFRNGIGVFKLFFSVAIFFLDEVSCFFLFVFKRAVLRLLRVLC